MIPKILLMMIVARAVYGWPITPLDGYSRTITQDVTLKCGDNYGYGAETFKRLNITFDKDGGTFENGKCKINLRVYISDEKFSHFGLKVTGSVTIKDPNNGNQCASSYLALADEDDSEDEFIHTGKYCGEKSLDYTTDEDVLIIDLSVQKDIAPLSGFMLLVEPHYVCGGEVNFNTRIHSPNYPDKYPRSMNCLWKVLGPIGKSIKIKCTDFDLKPKKSNKCMDTFNIVGKGTHRVECGSSFLNEEITIQSHFAALDFRSGDFVGNYRGFNCVIKFVERTKDLLLAKFFKQ